jgi:23S rRNA (guanosine2251-2'-O)-methyltransferase
MSNNRKLVLVVHNIRSSHNVGSLLRTADTMGIQHVYLTGYTPHASYHNDPRLPHEAARQTRQIQKTALGAEAYVLWTYSAEVMPIIIRLKKDGYQICALEQHSTSVPLPSFSTKNTMVALVVGNEVDGIAEDVVKSCDAVLEIPMLSKKESLNVVQAAAMALYHLRFLV